MSWVCCTMVLSDMQSRCPVCGRQSASSCNPQTTQKVYTAADLAAAESAAYKRGMEAGRKERTVEIDKTYGSYHLGDAKRNPMHKLSIELRFDYPECFGEEAEKP